MDCPEAQVVEATPVSLHTYRLRERADYRLTPQERHLLRLLIEGHHKKAAARAMGISINTVSFHLKNMYVKLQVHSKTEAVVKALQEGLVVLVRRERCRSEPVQADQEVPAETARYNNHARANANSRSIVARDTPTEARLWPTTTHWAEPDPALDAGAFVATAVEAVASFHKSDAAFSCRCAISARFGTSVSSGASCAVRSWSSGWESPPA